MLSIDISVIAIFTIVWILVLVLTKVYFKPVSRVMKERDDRLQQDRGSAQEALEKYDSILAKIEEDLKAAKSETREIREKFDREAQKEKEKMIEEVSLECRAQVDRARKELEKKVAQLKKELEPSSQELAEKIAKRLLN
jgi:F-type H+-transporting ATPase subunit b